MKFTSLTKALEGLFDKPLAELSSALRRRIDAEFMVSWDSLSVEQRKYRAQALDWQNDPALEQERQDQWDHFVAKDDIRRAIEKWEATPTPDAVNLATQETRLAELRKRLAELESEDRDNRNVPQGWACPPVNAAQIRQYFPVKGDPDKNAQWWRKKMEAARDNGLDKCRVGAGKKGQGGSMWQPDEVAHWLLNRHKKWGKGNVGKVKGYEGMDKNALHAALKKIPGCDAFADEWFLPD